MKKNEAINFKIGCSDLEIGFSRPFLRKLKLWESIPFAKGMKAYKQASFKEAEVIFSKLAEKNSADAQYKLAHIYEHGLTGKRDIKKAFNLYDQSAKQGNCWALVRLGKALYQGEYLRKNVKKSLAYFDRASSSGDVRAHLYLAKIYRSQDGVEPNLSTSISFYKKAARQGNIQACLNLAHILSEEGKVDDAEVISYYKKAALKNNAEALYNLSLLYANGGSNAKKRTGIANTKANEQGHALSQAEHIDVLMRKKTATTQDKDNLVYCLKKQINLGDLAAETYLNALTKNESPEFPEDNVENVDGDMHFDVAVVATMSSGKSTTLNALMGAPYLPSKNEACTSAIFKIIDGDGVVGCQGRKKSSGGQWGPWGDIGMDQLVSWNDEKGVEIELNADFPHIDNHYSAVRFFDTPGPNNALDMDHAEITKSMLNNAEHGYMVFVMNATQFGVNDEWDLLKTLCESLKGKAHKVVFVINKMDELDVELGESPLSLIESVNAYIQEIGFDDPVVIPIMSMTSLNIRGLIGSLIKGSDHGISKRSQRKLISELQLLSEFKDSYLPAISHSDLNRQLFKEAKLQSRHWDLSKKIELAGKDVSLGQLVEMDLLTGIPLLEELIENELIMSSLVTRSSFKLSNKEYGVLRNQGVKLLRKGWTQGDIAKHMKTPVSIVSNWAELI